MRKMGWRVMKFNFRKIGARHSAMKTKIRLEEVTGDRTPGPLMILKRNPDDRRLPDNPNVAAANPLPFNATLGSRLSRAANYWRSR
jgi:hypothetical protein